MKRLNDYQKAQKWLEGYDWDDDPNADDNLNTICYALQEIGKYKDLDKQGKLLKLPCAVGDTVYRICPKCNESHNGSCKNCAWENSCSNRGCTVYGGWKDGQYLMGECTIVPYKVSWNYIPNLLENIGRRVFLTREEAEAALNEISEK